MWGECHIYLFYWDFFYRRDKNEFTPVNRLNLRTSDFDKSASRPRDPRVSLCARWLRWERVRIYFVRSRRVPLNRQGQDPDVKRSPCWQETVTDKTFLFVNFTVIYCNGVYDIRRAFLYFFFPRQRHNLRGGRDGNYLGSRAYTSLVARI